MPKSLRNNALQHMFETNRGGGDNKSRPGRRTKYEKPYQGVKDAAIKKSKTAKPRKGNKRENSKRPNAVRPKSKDPLKKGASMPTAAAKSHASRVASSTENSKETDTRMKAADFVEMIKNRGDIQLRIPQENIVSTVSNLTAIPTKEMDDIVASMAQGNLKAKAAARRQDRQFKYERYVKQKRAKNAILDATSILTAENNKIVGKDEKEVKEMAQIVENSHRTILNHMNRDVMQNLQTRLSTEKVLEDRLVFLRRQNDAVEREKKIIKEEIETKSKRNKEALEVKEMMETKLDDLAESILHQYVRNHRQRAMVMSAATEKEYSFLCKLQKGIVSGEENTDNAKRYTPILYHILAREKELYKRDANRLEYVASALKEVQLHLERFHLIKVQLLGSSITSEQRMVTMDNEFELDQVNRRKALAIRHGNIREQERFKRWLHLREERRGDLKKVAGQPNSKSIQEVLDENEKQKNHAQGMRNLISQIQKDTSESVEMGFEELQEFLSERSGIKIDCPDELYNRMLNHDKTIETMAGDVQELNTKIGAAKRKLERIDLDMVNATTAVTHAARHSSEREERVRLRTLEEKEEEYETNFTVFTEQSDMIDKLIIGLNDMRNSINRTLGAAGYDNRRKSWLGEQEPNYEGHTTSSVPLSGESSDQEREVLVDQISTGFAELKKSVDTVRRGIGTNENTVLDDSMNSATSKSAANEQMSKFNIRIETPRIEMTDGQKRRAAATSKIRTSAMIRSKAHQNSNNLLLRAMQETQKKRSLVIDRYSLRTADGGLKTLNEIEYEGNASKDVEDENISELRSRARSKQK
jgi:hypothetical protein